MGRRAHPWYRRDRDTWYAEIRGKQVPLAKGKGARAEAEREFHRLMAAGPRARQPTGPPPVGELVVAYLEHCDRQVADGELEQPGTVADYQRRLSDFADVLGTMPSDQVRPKDVTAWLATHADWGPTTRHDAIGTVKTIFRWAVRSGHLSADPLIGLDKPRRRMRRELIMDPEQVPEVLGAILSPGFRDLCLFLSLTGCRPKEARTIEDHQIDWENVRVILHEHKTKRHTDKARIITLSWAAACIAKRNAIRNPVGPIFRNEDGAPWTKDAMNCQIRRIRERTGMGREVVSYAFRHLMATHLLERGIPLATVAEILGHSSPAMLARVYSHLAERHEHLREAVNRAMDEE